MKRIALGILLLFLFPGGLRAFDLLDINEKDVDGAYFPVEFVNPEGRVYGVGSVSFLPAQKKIRGIAFRAPFDKMLGSKDAVFCDFFEMDLEQWAVADTVIAFEGKKFGALKMKGRIQREAEFDYKVFINGENGNTLRTLSEKGLEFKRNWIPSVMLWNSFSKKQMLRENSDLSQP